MINYTEKMMQQLFHTRQEKKIKKDLQEGVGPCGVKISS